MNLTTLANVKQWGQITGDSADSLLTQLIVSASALVNSLISVQSLAWRLVSECYDGGGNSFMLLRQCPVTDVVALTFDDGCSIPASAPATAGQPRTRGYFLEAIQPTGIQQRLDLYCARFPRGRSCVQVDYHAGYRTTDTAVVPQASPYTVPTVSVWMGDIGVTYANGTALTAVPGAPAAGQYSVDANGLYTFAAADANASVLISYACVPAELVQAVNEIIMERYKISGDKRFGVSGMTVGGRESVTFFSQKDMNAFASGIIDLYRKTTPA